MQEPSITWVEKIMEKNNFHAKKPSVLEENRFSSCTTTKMSDWFQSIEDQLKEENIDIKTHNINLIFNMDETMISSDKYLQVFTKNKCAVTKTINISDEHVTILVTINAAGNYFEPTIIFPRKTLPSILEKMVNQGKIIVGGQENGWINQSTFDAWCKWFVSKVNLLKKELKLDENAILFLDGHNSRENPDAIKYLKENNVTVVILPNHSTHVMQPLDVSIFSPFKKFLTKNKKRYMEELKLESNDKYSECDIKRFKLALLLLDSLQQACIQLNILNGFQKGGISPWNKDEVLNNKRIIQDSPTIINLTPLEKKKININGKVLTNDKNLNELIFDKERKEKVTEIKNLNKKKKRIFKIM